MRLRTLPLSAAGVVLGMLLANADWKVNPWTALLLLLTTISLQVLSNLSNELGDVLRGTDRAGRQGPEYGLNSGEMSVKDMKFLIGGAVASCIIFGTAMTWHAFGTLLDMTPVLVLLLGAAAILGAMKYTLGRNPYGYRAKGDFYVFIFFGLVSVLGSYLVSTGGAVPHWKVLFPASAIGCFSVAVLNVNNIRDMEEDRATRVTIAMKLGEKKAKIYQTVLIVLGWAFLVTYCLLCWPSVWHWLWVLTLPLYVLHLRGVWSHSGRELDPMLPLLVMSTFVLSLLMGLGFNSHLL